MNVTNPIDVALNLASTEIKSYPLAALGAAVDLAEAPIGAVGQAGALEIAAVVITPSAALSSSDTLFRTITIAKRTAGAAGTTIATITTKTSGSGGTGDWTAWKPVVVALSGITVSSLDALTITVTHASTGTAIPLSTVEFFTSVR